MSNGASGTPESKVIVHFSASQSGLTLSIPAKLALGMGAGAGTAAELSVEDGRLVVTPIHADSMPDAYLATLVAAINDENRHAEIDTGGPVGAEIG